MAALVTLATVKGYLPSVSAGDGQWDDLLARLISATSIQFEGEAGRTLASAAATEVYDGDGSQSLTLRRWPVSAVTSVTVNGTVIPTRATVTGDGWVLGPDDRLYLSGYFFTYGLQNVSIVYTAGYSTVPADVQQAVCKMVALQFKDKDRIGQATRSIAGESSTYADAPVLAYWRSVVDAYRLPVPG